MTFMVKVPAKCVLAGEHVVANQGSAIVLPYKSLSLTLTYTSGEIHTIDSISAEGINSMQLLLWSVVRRAFALVNQSTLNLTGYFNIVNTIPIGGGLGFSSALSAGVAKWAVYYGLIDASDLFEFTMQLENKFHGKSSGLDVAGVMAEQVIQYTSSHETTPIDMKWQPSLYISSSGEHSISDSCREAVIAFRKNHADKAQLIDEKMRSAVNKVKLGLESGQKQGFSMLAEGLELGNECYFDWELVSRKLKEHLNELKKYAVASKIIGAGYGGHVVSLFNGKPKANIPFKLYNCFE